jgi:peptidoglycan hydrolase-like protein with peptidoglycan-binding domain
MTTAQIQTALNAWGASPPLTPDGSYGPLTRAATIAFQHAKGLTEDGKAGALTQTQLQPYLNRAVSVSASPAPRQTPAAAAAPAQTRSVTLSNTQVQTALNAAGAMPPLVVDGSLGPKSKAAVKAFQATHGLAADGVPGPLTQAALMPYLTALT